MYRTSVLETDRKPKIFAEELRSRSAQNQKGSKILMVKLIDIKLPYAHYNVSRYTLVITIRINTEVSLWSIIVLSRRYTSRCNRMGSQNHEEQYKPLRELHHLY